LEIDISDADGTISFFAILRPPVKARVFSPVKISNVADARSNYVFLNSLEEILLVNLNSNQSLNLGTDKLVGEVITAHVR